FDQRRSRAGRNRCDVALDEGLPGLRPGLVLRPAVTLSTHLHLLSSLPRPAIGGSGTIATRCVLHTPFSTCCYGARIRRARPVWTGVPAGRGCARRLVLRATCGP